MRDQWKRTILSIKKSIELLGKRFVNLRNMRDKMSAYIAGLTKRRAHSRQPDKTSEVSAERSASGTGVEPVSPESSRNISENSTAFLKPFGP